MSIYKKLILNIIQCILKINACVVKYILNVFNIHI